MKFLFKQLKFCSNIFLKRKNFLLISLAGGSTIDILEIGGQRKGFLRGAVFEECIIL